MEILQSYAARPPGTAPRRITLWFPRSPVDILGAAAHEYGLARLTRAYLGREGYASFEADWVPAEYLADY